MQESTFDRLVSELSREQRRDMLDKLSSSMSATSEDVTATEMEGLGDSIDLGEYMRQLGLFSRIWLFLRAIFRGREQEDILETDLLRDVARRIVRRVPDVLDISRMQARPGLYKRLRSLEQASRTCYEIVGPAAYRHRAAFLAFLLEMESEELKLRIDSDADPARIVENKPRISDGDLKRTLERNLEDILESMPSSVRSKMYVNAQFLEHFRRLGSFDFASIFALFHAGRGTDVEPCDLSSLRSYIADLASIGRGLRVTPGEVLLRSLYLFVRQGDDSEDDESRDEAVSYRLERFASGFRTVQEFFSEVPLEGLSKLAANSIHFKPEYGGGGEDWFSLIKRFWQERIDEVYQRFTLNRHQQQLLSEASELVGAPVSSLEAFEGEEPGVPSRYAVVLGLIDAFMLRVFREHIHAVLRIVQVSGDFYKQDNQKAFNQCFEKLREIPHRINKFRKQIGPDGTMGKRLEAISHEARDRQRMLDQRRPIISELEKEAQAITTETIEALRTLVLVLTGILHSSGSEEYDTLSNLPAIEGSNNEVFLRRLNAALEKSSAAEKLISRAYDLATVRKL